MDQEVIEGELAKCALRVLSLPFAEGARAGPTVGLRRSMGARRESISSAPTTRLFIMARMIPQACRPRMARLGSACV